MERAGSISSFSGAPILVQTVEELQREFVCVMCGGVMVDPRALDCTHAFCRRCIASLAHSSPLGRDLVRCPFRCDRRTHIPGGDAGRLPRSRVVENACLVLRRLQPMLRRHMREVEAGGHGARPAAASGTDAPALAVDPECEGCSERAERLAGLNAPEPCGRCGMLLCGSCRVASGGAHMRDCGPFLEMQFDAPRGAARAEADMTTAGAEVLPCRMARVTALALLSRAAQGHPSGAIRLSRIARRRLDEAGFKPGVGVDVRSAQFFYAPYRAVAMRCTKRGSSTAPTLAYRVLVHDSLRPIIERIGPAAPHTAEARFLFELQCVVERCCDGAARVQAAIGGLSQTLQSEVLTGQLRPQPLRLAAGGAADWVAYRWAMWYCLYLERTVVPLLRACEAAVGSAGAERAAALMRPVVPVLIPPPEDVVATAWRHTARDVTASASVAPAVLLQIAALRDAAASLRSHVEATLRILASVPLRGDGSDSDNDAVAAALAAAREEQLREAARAVVDGWSGAARGMERLRLLTEDTVASVSDDAEHAAVVAALVLCGDAARDSALFDAVASDAWMLARRGDWDRRVAAVELPEPDTTADARLSADSESAQVMRIEFATWLRNIAHQRRVGTWLPVDDNVPAALARLYRVLFHTVVATAVGPRQALLSAARSIQRLTVSSAEAAAFAQAPAAYAAHAITVARVEEERAYWRAARHFHASLTELQRALPAAASSIGPLLPDTPAGLPVDTENSIKLCRAERVAANASAIAAAPVASLVEFSRAMCAQDTRRREAAASAALRAGRINTSWCIEDATAAAATDGLLAYRVGRSLRDMRSARQTDNFFEARLPSALLESEDTDEAAVRQDSAWGRGMLLRRKRLFLPRMTPPAIADEVAWVCARYAKHDAAWMRRRRHHRPRTRAGGAASGADRAGDDDAWCDDTPDAAWCCFGPRDAETWGAAAVRATFANGDSAAQPDDDQVESDASSRHDHDAGVVYSTDGDDDTDSMSSISSSLSDAAAEVEIPSLPALDLTMSSDSAPTANNALDAAVVRAAPAPGGAQAEGAQADLPAGEHAAGAAAARVVRDLRLRDLDTETEMSDASGADTHSPRAGRWTVSALHQDCVVFVPVWIVRAAPAQGGHPVNVVLDAASGECYVFKAGAVSTADDGLVAEAARRVADRGFDDPPPPLPNQPAQPRRPAAAATWAPVRFLPHRVVRSEGLFWAANVTLASLAVGRFCFAAARKWARSLDTP